jgi:xylulokinase
MAEAAGRPRDERFVLAVDLGSTALKIGLVSLTGRIAWWARTDLTTLHGPGGAVTQDAEEWWREIVTATKRGLAEGPVLGDQVVAVAVTGQWSSTVPVDAAGHPVAPCSMWMDTRGGRHSRALVGGRVQGYNARALVEWVRRTGGIPSLSGGDATGTMLHLDRDEPAVAAATSYYLEPVEYLTMRFTGVPAATHASAFPRWLTDNRHTDVLAYDPALVATVGVNRAKLPPLIRAGSVVAPVTAAVADELGIPVQAAVVNGLPDLHASAVGSGCLGIRQAHMAVSTTTWVSCPVPRKKTDVLRQIASVPGFFPGQFLMVNNQRTSGRCLEWLRDQVVTPGDGLVDGAAPDLAALTKLAETVPAGARGVVFTPWLDGENSPIDDARARAGFHNLGLRTSRADMVRAVLEGVAYNASWLLEAADHFVGHRLDPVRLIGGGTQSDLWCQIIADVADRRMERVAEPLLTGLRGAGLYAGMVLGEVRPDEVHDLVPVDATFTPAPANRAVYDRLSSELPRLYKAQRRMFHRLNRGRDEAG